jgi:two-component system, OmpR family, sensor histidine kinase SenX3
MIRGARALGHNRRTMLLRLPAAVALILAAALAAILAGLLALHQMIAAERADALAAIDQRHSAAAQIATRELASALKDRAGEARARIDAAVANPLRGCAGCYRRQGGDQVLPRLGPGQVTTGATRSLEAYHRELIDRASAGDGTDREWARRARLHAGCRASAAPARRAAVEAILKDRAHYALPVEQELASALALAGDCGLPPGDPLLAALLRTGLDVVGGRRVEGLMPLLLRHLHDLGPADAAYAREQILAAAGRGGVPAGDFQARLAEAVTTPLPLPAQVDGPTLAPGPNPGAGGAPAVWYLEPAAGGAEGLTVDLAPMLAAIADRMRSGGLLAAGDRLDVRVPASHAVALGDLRVGVTSPAAGAARDAIGRRTLVKLGLLALCGAMALAIAVLGVALQGRRQRILEIKAQFVAGVSHELRTPLASMRVLAETLLRRTQNLEQVRDYPARLLRDVDGMSFLVENILSFNRMGRGLWQPRPEPLHIGELVAGVCDEAAERAGRSLRLQVDLDERDATVAADPELVRLLVRNLAVNAIGYNRRDPVEIGVRARRGDDGSLTVDFSDNGVGIAPGERERVFEDFYRGQGSESARGSGLGLALCRRVMALHGGTIAIQRSDDSGTVFRLWFPPPPHPPAS